MGVWATFPVFALVADEEFDDEKLPRVQLLLLEGVIMPFVYPQKIPINTQNIWISKLGPKLFGNRKKDLVWLNGNWGGGKSIPERFSLILAYLLAVHI